MFGAFENLCAHIEKIPDEQEVCLDFGKRIKAFKVGGIGKEDWHMYSWENYF